MHQKRYTIHIVGFTYISEGRNMQQIFGVFFCERKRRFFNFIIQGVTGRFLAKFPTNKPKKKKKTNSYES